ncbi:hypothetical protein EUX98_g8516 [Antrodiella citrinella]|uniref:Uncharacterized protein n=1 Tax=Antrodiella citrinella TaxID=2447956 RepID=A0A4S4M867_9APHY|nr:hypothetical protein EUX98_g8516 [Antrodiella citrinella]
MISSRGSESDNCGGPARVSTPYPSSNGVSPSRSSKGGSFGSDELDGVVEIPVSSSPATSPTAVVTTPPEDVSQDFDRGVLGPVKIVAQVTSTVCGDVSENEDSVLTRETHSYAPAKQPLSDDIEHEDDDESSGGTGSESWIEDYNDTEPELSGSELEFLRGLDTRLIRILEQRSRIQALPPDENISPYSRDLRARAAGLPAISFGEISSDCASDDLLLAAHSSEPPDLTVCASAITVVQSEPRSPSASDTATNEYPSSAPSGTHLLLDPIPLCKDDQGLHTPELQEAATATPLAPKKALRHIHLPGPREQPPRISLPTRSQSLDSVSLAQNAITSDVFMVGPPSMQKEEELRAYSQVSSSKRAVPELTDEVEPKRPKLSFHGGRSQMTMQPRPSHIHPSLLFSGKFATRRASLRKAASLRSEVSVEELDEEVHIKPEPDVETSLHRLSISPIKYAQHSGVRSSLYPPTQPVTPMPLSSRDKFRAEVADQVKSPDSLLDPLPCIAPPPYPDIPRAPANEEEVAEHRLAMMISKEQEQRRADGLILINAPVANGSPDMKTEDTSSCDLDEIDEAMDEEETQDDTAYKINSSRNVSTEIDEVEIDCDNDEAVILDWSLLETCIDDEFRQEVVEWILDVVPPEFTSKPTIGKHLREQLTTSSDTRWHAAQLFNRYFVRLGSSPPSSPRSEYGDELNDGQKVTSEDERAGTVWDIALASLALSVKFHRDVLGPFFPVLAEEFLIIASHEIEYEHLEAAQRDVFSSFSYCIGSVTPGAYIQELWDALPSLRQLLSFKGACEAVKRAAWEILYDALFELSYLKFSTGLLTACAMVHGIVDTLILKARVDATTPLLNRTERWRSRRGARCDCTEMRKTAQNTVKPLVADISEVCQIKEKDWDECWKWLEVLLDGR